MYTDTSRAGGQRLPRSGFALDIEEGFSSATFNAQQNVDEEDTRAGLGDEKYVIRDIMQREQVDFDEARLIYTEQRMREAGIDPSTGLSSDPRATVFDKKPMRIPARKISDKLLAAIATRRKILLVSLVLAVIGYFILHHMRNWWATVPDDTF